MKKQINSRRKFLLKAGILTGAALSFKEAFGAQNLQNMQVQNAINQNQTRQNMIKNSINKKGSKLSLTKNAKENVTKLFGEIDAEFVEQDAEFFSNYMNFAFDEVIENSKLELKERLMIILASLVAIPALSEFKNFIEPALKNGVKPEEIKEIIYQATPYVGFGKVIDFINLSNAEFKRLNIALPLKNQGTTTRQNRYEKGLEAQMKIFGDAILRGDAATPKDEKHIRAFLSANCFGDYYTREGIDLKFRELLTFIYIISQGGLDAQAKAHALGNVNMGNSREKLIAAVTALVPYIGYPKTLNALAAIDSLKS